MLLALDTATEWAAIALFDPEQARVLYEATWWASRQHTTTLLPAIDRAMREMHLTPRALSAVALTIGPGSYTGLRVGLSLAKGIVLALGIPLIPVPTLDVVAYPYRHMPSPVCAIIQAGRSRVCWAVYPPEAALSPLDGYHLDEVAAVANALKNLERPVFVVGELPPHVRSGLQDALGERVQFGSSADGLRRPGFLAELAYLRWRQGQQADPDTLTPIYLRQLASQ